MKQLLLKISRITAGVICIIIGVIGGFIPILQGWVFILLGLGLLSKDIPYVAKKRDQLKEWLEEKKRKKQERESATHKTDEKSTKTSRPIID
ncbi:MAG: hypothetical protein C4527_16300 [Candidatus Omnitrophota bacterium]|jgi:uncharacterized membrane protein YbaN (DUF454 family)|nr:MAG: hypothetical protein C4527_16300 [Candidatus Omnitrophota bacterium]